jgi:lysozyme
MRTNRKKRTGKKKGRVLLVLVCGALFFIAPYLIVRGSGAAKPASRRVPASASSATLSDPFPLLSLEQRVNGMQANGMVSLRLIDIYHSTSVTDWALLGKNIDGIYMKATEGTTFIDADYRNFAAAAKAHGMPFGFYHYFWPQKNAGDAARQADAFYNAIHGISYDFRPALDVEETNGQTAETIAANVNAFAAEFEKLTKQRIMLYCSPSFADRYLGDQSMAAYPLWIANYQVNDPKQTMVWKTFDVWQYGVSTVVPGVSGRVDTDVATNAIYLDANAAPRE